MAAARLTNRIVHLLRRVDRCQLGEDQRHDGALPEAGDDLPRRVGEQRGLVLLRLAESAGEIVHLVHGVRVGKEKLSASGGLCPGPAGVVLAGKAAATAQVERRSIEDDYAVVAGGGFGAISRVCRSSRR